MTNEQETKLWHLKTFNVLKVLSLTEKMRLALKATMKAYKAGDIIYFRDDPGKLIYFLKKGSAKLYRYSEQGEEIIFEIVRPGELFGELAWIHNTPQDKHAQALTDVLLCYLDVQEWEWEKFVTTHPKMKTSIMKWMGGKMVQLERRLESLQFKDTKTRVVELLKDLADTYGRKLGLGYEIELKIHLTHKDMAQLTATSRQSVTTILKELERNDIISYDRRRILIRKYEILQRLSL